MGTSPVFEPSVRTSNKVEVRLFINGNRRINSKLLHRNVQKGKDYDSECRFGLCKESTGDVIRRLVGPFEPEKS